MPAPTRPAGALLGALLALTLVACGGNPSPEETAPTSASDITDTEPHNEADVELAQMMIVHHRDALTMADLVESRSEDLAVLALGERIAAAQKPEIDVMSAWLESWGEDVPGEGEAMGSMDHGEDMPGAMTEEDMAALEAASGEEFDRAFLTQMIAHHQGAIEMAEAHIESGEAPAAVALSRRIAATQNAEIEEMRALLAP